MNLRNRIWQLKKNKTEERALEPPKAGTFIDFSRVRMCQFFHYKVWKE